MIISRLSQDLFIPGFGSVIFYLDYLDVNPPEKALQFKNEKKNIFSINASNKMIPELSRRCKKKNNTKRKY